MKKFVLFCFIVVMFFQFGCIPFLYRYYEKNFEFDIVEIHMKADIPEKKSVSITAVGDCTLGSDPNFGYSNSFHELYDKNDDNYFFSGVYSITGSDDITLANLETTLTNQTKRAVKKFNFKGPANYSNILKSGSVEIVNIANNHIYDYLEEGYNDTVNALNSSEIKYCGNNNYYIYETKGVKVGFIGYYANYNSEIYNQVKEGLDYLKSKDVDLIIVSYHWGIERDYKQNEQQQELGRWSIDNGADLVIGHHPHVVQGIELYNGKYIVYSLGNFVFGGNKNPSDKDTFLFQETFDFENNQLKETTINVYPARLSSTQNINDYKPVLLYDKERERILNKLSKYSENVVLE